MKEKLKKALPHIIIIAVVFSTAFILRVVIGVTTVTGLSMYPTLHDGDFISTAKVENENDITRGDIVLVNEPYGQSLIKRVIGLPGETVEIKDERVFVNGKELDDYVGKPTEPASDGWNKVTLASDEYYVLGDNRDASSDSRVYGPVKTEQITKKFAKILLRIK